MLYRYLKYRYQHKHRWLDTYIQDLIASKTNFKPYKIKLLVAKKENPKKHNELDLFTFIYEGKYYYLDSKNKLHLKAKETIKDVI